LPQIEDDHAIEPPTTAGTRAGALPPPTRRRSWSPFRFRRGSPARSRAQAGVRKEDFEKDDTTFERQWAELSYIHWWLTQQIGSGEAGFFDDAAFGLDGLLAEYAVLSAEVVRLREDASSHAADAWALVPRARALRGKLARLAACYLVHRYGVDERLDTAAKEFGLPVGRTANDNPFNYIVIYLIALSLSVYVGVYVSAIVFDLLSSKPLVDALSRQDDQLVWRWISPRSSRCAPQRAV
jgi:hypothetical protein